MKKMNKWFWVAMATSVALVAAIIVAIVLGVTGRTTEIPEGPETGMYYYDAESGEYTLHLHSGNQFTLNDGVARVGEYTVSEDTLTFNFTKESNGEATAKLAGNVLTLTYNNQEIRFLKKVNFTVTFDANGGESATGSVTVVNGKTVAKPDDPTKAGYLFVGWYTDKEMTTPYIFGSSVITGDTTLYAKWTEKVVGQVEYTVDFEGADIEEMTTYGGKLYNVPVPTKEGYTFGGWWISDYENGEKLTVKYSEGTVFEANTTLFAVWVKAEGDKLAAPLVDVTEDGLSWANVDGASTYAVKITAPDGIVAYEDNVSATTLNFNFAKAGGYVVEVTAVATNTANNSATTVRYYNAKALNRVSLFTVVEPSTVIFNSVGADKYYITVACGNANHKHEMLDNGKSTVFNFSNCDMKEGGIEITVTATKNGCAQSVSETFVYEKKLDKVAEITVDATTETVVWSPVKNAAYYAVSVTVGENTLPTVYVNEASYSLKALSAGDVTVKVTPVTTGYLSAEAAEVTYTKATLSAPTAITINGTVISWNAVTGATSYTVKVGTKEFETKTAEATLDLAAVDATFANGEIVTVSVKATADDKSSVYSDEITAKYNGFDGNLVYSNGVISWSPAIGEGSYDVAVNGTVVASVTDANSYALTFKAAGTYTVSVTFYSDAGYETHETEVTIYAITFDSRLGTGVKTMYIAAGDLLNLPTDSTRPGYTFSGWYNTPSASNGNGRLYADVFYNEKDSVVLYADWTPNTYYIILEADADISGAADGDRVAAVYSQSFKLPVVESDDGAFLGWYTGSGGTGIQLTDARGDSVGVYTNIKDTSAYPYFAQGVLEYYENKDGTYSVTGGFNIDQVIDLVVPDTYNGKPITAILENAFEDGSSKIKTVSLPNTVTLIGTGALDNLYYLEYVDIREVEGNHEPIYSSCDGALLRNDFGVNYLELVPRYMTGEFTVPATVDSIRHKAFYSTNYLTKITISKEVTYIADEAFYGCSRLEEIVFEEGGTAPLTIEPTAFYSVKKLTSITLPARVENLSIKTFDTCVALETIKVEEGGENYGSIDGMLTNGALDTILYCPVTRTGVVEIPTSVLAVGESAFAGRAGITSVIIHNKMTEIGKGAFADCGAVRSVIFEGGRNADLVIGEGAFKGNTDITSVRFEDADTSSVDLGAVVIGASAFEDCDKIGELYFANTANIAEIGASAFKGCERIPSLIVPATTQLIGDRAFSGCNAIQSITFAEGGVDIAFGEFVFSGCAQLTSISIPATVTVFDGSVFEGCNNITTIIVDKDNPALVAENGILYDKAKTEIMYYPRAKTFNFADLPSTLTKIGAAAFQSNYSITSLTIPAGITEIGANAFDKCIYLSEVIFETTGNITIGDYAFANCPVLTSITLPANLTEIGDYAFYQSGLGKIAGSETEFGTVVIPNAVTSIGDYAFAYTMLNSINIPASVETIGEGAFYKCKNLATLTVEEGNKTLAIGSPEDECGVFEGTALVTASLSKRTETIGVRAFYNLNTLKTVTLPAGSKLTTIGDSAFYNNKFTEIALPEGLVSIGVEAFRYNNDIASVTIPSTVTDIGEYAFANMKSLTNFVFADADTATTPLSINDYAFANDIALVSITLPKRLERIYDSVTLGSGFHVTSFYTVFDGCSALENIFVADGCVQFSDVQGVFYVNDENGNPATLVYCPRGKTGEISVPSTVTLVQNLAFRGAKVNRVVFEEMENWNGESTLRIGDTMRAESEDDEFAVFGGSDNTMNNGNTNLQEVVFPAHLASVGSYAFLNAGSSTKTVKITFNRDAGPVEFGEYAITDCDGLGELLFPKVASVPEKAFCNNSYLEKVSFGKGSTVEKIGYFSFTNDRVYYLYDIPASVKVIDSYGFASCGIREITWEEGSQLHTLGASGFSSAQFKSFVFPEHLEVIGAGAFSSVLEEITLNSVIKSTVSPTGSSIFSSLSSSSALRKINLPDDNPYLELVDGALYSEDMSILMCVPPMLDMGDKTAFDIDDRVTVIEAAAFANFPNPIVLHEGILKIGSNAFRAASLSEIVIPASVTELATYSLYGMKNLTTVTFAPNAVLTTVGNYAFSNCEQLVLVDLPDTVTEIGTNAFYYCTKLESIDLPTSLTAIPRNLFYQCTALKNVTMHENVTNIGYYAFYKCTALESIHIPASVVEFEASTSMGVFEECTALKNVTFAEGSELSNLPTETFYNCKSLESITLPDKIVSISANAFSGCTNLKNVVIGGTWTDLPADFFKGMTKLETVVLPDTVETIGANAFDGCTNLKNFTLPASVETIGEAAFRNCASLASVEIGEDVASIGNYAFDGCASLASVVFAENSALNALGDDPAVESAIFRGTTALTAIELPDSITSMGANVFQNSGLSTVALPSRLSAIGNYAFSGCANLTKVAIPSTVKSVGDFSFENCSGLVEAKLASGVEAVGTGVFSNCVRLETVNIPASVMNIAGNPFINCPSLVNFDFDSSNPDYVLLDGALMDSGKFTIIYYLPTNVPANGVYNIPSTVGVIAKGAFCDSQIVSISIPEKVKEIPSMAFMNSKKLETVTLTDSITSIGDEAFKNCTALTGMTIPEVTANVGAGAFEGCTSLETVNFVNRTTAITVGARAFKDCTSLSNINIPAQLTGLSEYMLANTAITEFTVPTAVTSLDVIGVLAGCSKLETVTIHDGVTGNLGNEFFMDCASLKAVTLPAGITTIGEVEYIGLQQYSTSHYFQKYGSSIYSGAFKGCTSLESIDLSHVSHLGAHAFEGCTSLTDIKFAKEMYAIGDYAFAGCTSLVEVDMYNNLYGCNGKSPLQANYTPSQSGYTQVDYKSMAFGAFVFADCTSLEKVSLPGTDDASYAYPNYKGMDTLKDGVFKNCTSLKLVVVSTISSFDIGAKPFEGVPSDCIVFINKSSSYNAQYIHSTYRRVMVNSQYVENLDWLRSTDAVIMGIDGSILLNTSTYDTAQIKTPVVSTWNGAPASSMWSIGEDGTVYSKINYYWDEKRPDGTIGIDEAYYFDKDGSIYTDFEGEDNSDDYLVGVKNGKLYYPTPVKEENGALTFENGTRFYVMTDPALYTIDNGFVTFAASFNPSSYDAIIIKDGTNTYVLGYSSSVYFTRVTVDAEGNTTVLTVAKTESGELKLDLSIRFNADGSVDFADGVAMEADGTVPFANGAKCIRREVVDGETTTYEWVLILEDGTEYTDGYVFIDEDGHVMEISLNF